MQKGQQILPLTQTRTQTRTFVGSFIFPFSLSPISHCKILTNQTLSHRVWPAVPAAANRLLPSNSNQSNQINKQHPHQTTEDDGRFFFLILKSPFVFSVVPTHSLHFYDQHLHRRPPSNLPSLPLSPNNQSSSLSPCPYLSLPPPSSFHSSSAV